MMEQELPTCCSGTHRSPEVVVRERTKHNLIFFLSGVKARIEDPKQLHD